jgi:hypothetical protein
MIRLAGPGPLGFPLLASQGVTARSRETGSPAARALGHRPLFPPIAAPGGAAAAGPAIFPCGHRASRAGADITSVLQLVPGADGPDARRPFACGVAGTPRGVDAVGWDERCIPGNSLP